MEQSVHPRIGVVSPTTVVVPDVKASFAHEWPDANLLMLVDDALYDGFANGGRVVTSRAIERLRRLFALSVDAGVEAVVFAGSVFGQAVRTARQDFKVPILTSFEAMIGEALQGGLRLKVLSTADESRAQLTEELEAASAAASFSCNIDSEVLPEAFRSLYERGDRAAHDGLVAEAIERAADYDLLLVAQFSMSSAARTASTAGRAVLDPLGAAIRRLRTLTSTAVEHTP